MLSSKFYCNLLLPFTQILLIHPSLSACTRYVKCRSFAPSSVKTYIVLLTSSYACSWFISPHKLWRARLVKKLSMMLYTLARLTLFCRSCFTSLGCKRRCVSVKAVYCLSAIRRQRLDVLLPMLWYAPTIAFRSQQSYKSPTLTMAWPTVLNASLPAQLQMISCLHFVL